MENVIKPTQFYVKDLTFGFSKTFEKISEFMYKHRFLLASIFMFALFFLLPDTAFAQASGGSGGSGGVYTPKSDSWGSQIKALADGVANNLWMIVYPVALAAGVWIVISLWTGSKRLQDMIPWIIAVCLLIALPEFLKMIPKDMPTNT